MRDAGRETLEESQTDVTSEKRSKVQEEPDKTSLESALARLGLICAGVLLVSLCSDIWARVGPNAPHEGLFIVAIWVCLLGGLGLMATAFLSTRPLKAQPAILLMVLLSQWALHCSFSATETNSNAPSDTVTVSLHAAILNTLGENPYGYNMADVVSAYAVTGNAMTPHLDGAQVEYLPYPPLHFLSLRPILPWGLEGARFLYSLSHSLLLIVVFYYAPPRYRGVALVPVILSRELLHYPLYWSSDSTWTLLLALMLWNWKRPLARGVLLGLACAYKQTPWLFAPFLAVRILREEERPWRALAIYFATSFGTFCLISAPYALDNFGTWFQGTFDPMLSPYLPLGRGFSMLTQTGLLPFGKGYYTFVTLFLFAVAIWGYFLNYKRLRPLLWWFPALVLFFSFRSLQHYFIYSIPLLMMEMSRYDFDQTKQPKPRFWYLPPLTAVVGIALATIVYWPSPRTVSLEVVRVMPDVSRATLVELEVTNNDLEPIKPVFYARSGWRTYPWVIAEGPLNLKPGERARYFVGTDLNYRTVTGHQGGQILLTDGTAEEGYRAIAELPSWPSIRQARGFDGTPGRLWQRSGNAWFEGNEVRFLVDEDSKDASVSRSMTLPLGRLNFELNYPPGIPPSAALGIQVSDQDGRRISVFYSNREGRGYYDPQHFYKIQKAGPGWQSYSVDIRDLYSQANFELPTLRRIVRNDVELLDRPISVRFRLRSDTKVEGAALRNVRLEETEPGHRVADMLTHKADYQIVLGDIAARRRHFEKALALYQSAWPLDFPVRETQEGSFLVIPTALELRGKFPLAGWGWGEPELVDGQWARPVSGLLSTIPVLAKPGLKVRLRFAPPTEYSVRLDDEPWQEMGPSDSFEITGPARVRTISVIPKEHSGLAGIIVTP